MIAKFRIGKHRSEGFTLMELLVVLFIVGLIAAVAAPSVTGGIQRAKEAALLQNLAVMRKAIDDFNADRGAPPATLEDLVSEKYLSHVPEDPVARDDGKWSVQLGSSGAGVVDVRSSSILVGTDGKPYNEW